MRLIDADELKKWLKSPAGFRANCEDCVTADCLNCIIEEAIENAPTIEATPVVHGRWEAVHDGWGRCPNCHRMDSIHEKATHCRFCGTKMDGGVSDG